MKYGLSTSNLKEIQRVFTNNDRVKKVILFGSRAMGTYKPGSDVDLVIQGDLITLNDIISLNIRLEELDFLIHFDLLSWSSITDPNVLDHIKRVGIAIYDKSNFSLVD